MRPIERISPPSPKEFEARYVKASRPVILAGAIDHWPAMKKWSLDYFKCRFGDRMVPAGRARDKSLYDSANGVRYETIRVADYVDLLTEARPIDLYMAFRVHEALPELLDDLVRPDYCREAPWFRSRFWFAAPDTGGPLHRDLPENLYAQISGRKQFILLDKKHTRMVHQHPFYSGTPNYSPVNAEAPDLNRYPRFRDAPLMIATLEPGDLFFIPSLWWHQAHSLSTSISVNLWWVNWGPMLAVVKAAEAFMRIRDLKL